MGKPQPLQLIGFGTPFVASSAHLSGAQRSVQDPFSLSKSETCVRASLLQTSRLSDAVHILQPLYTMAGVTSVADTAVVVGRPLPTTSSSAWGLTECSHVGPGMVGWDVPYLHIDGTGKPGGAIGLQGVAGGPQPTQQLGMSLQTSAAFFFSSFLSHLPVLCFCCFFSPFHSFLCFCFDFLFLSSFSGLFLCVLCTCSFASSSLSFFVIDFLF